MRRSVLFFFFATASTAEFYNGTSSYTCLPSQACWPSLSMWQAFNTSIGGRLRATRLWAEPCYTDLTSDACLAVQEGYISGQPRSSIYGAMEQLNWEVCGNQSCQLNSLTGAPSSGVCSLGRLSAYYVEAISTSDVQKTLTFVEEHKIRLSIKNTGHDYMGRSAAANSLALWTHNMKDMEYHPEFSLSNGRNASSIQHVAVIGAGVQASEAYTYFQGFGMHVTVGAVGSVGLAGGFGQGGGHGHFGPSYGLMVDQAVEFDVVTADGKARTVNEFNDPDLFWAMRGGGGGTYAVLTAYKFRLHPAVPMNVYSFQADILNSSLASNLTQSKVYRDVITALANNQTEWSNERIAGYNFFLPNNIISIQILPSKDAKALKALTAQWSSFLTTYPGLNITQNEYKAFENFTDYATYIAPALATNGPVGVGIAEAARLVPRKQFTSPEDIEALVDAFLQGMQTSYELGAGLGTGSGQIYATGPANQHDNSKTGLHPAWRGSLWEVIHGGIYLSNYTRAEQDAIFDTVAQAIKPMKALTPEGGCYLNEGDWKESDWQQTFFGGNYNKLLKVKKMYDPTGLFSCWKCVGWTESDDSIGSC
ncbi:Glucooligosaccharide oxidase [Aplosporella prunicola CBS 121167]|uniref:Glucooligosaccharide oxidase n=1 Tax=Aplosporella prunicola CBS 121167 TaxID=1176127 RepID=A0A6A6B684_9PEZI|nr:Glucooligosaccharide oxidase [Aplosporella prunicola CBS 121167]KAF2138291.1 Glucooligosaccharide oxidase [Aplosporella prunicola CBS 121167]